MRHTTLTRAAAAIALGAALAVAHTGLSGRVVADDGPPTHETVLVPLAELGARASAVALHDSVLYVALNGRLATLDAKDPVRPVLIDQGPELVGEPRSIATDGEYAYVALAESGVAVVDVRDPTSSMLLTVVDTPGDAADVAVDSDYVYVADGARGLIVIDVSDPSKAHAVGALRTPRRSRSVVARDGWAYLGERDDLEYGVWVVDVTDPASPQSVAFADVPGGGDHVALRGAVVYVSVVVPGASPMNPWLGASVGVAAVDVADPAHPVVVMPGSPALPGGRFGGFSPSARSAVLVGSGAPVTPHQSRDVAGLVAWDLAVGGDRVYLVGGTVGGSTGRSNTPGQVQPTDPSVYANQILTVYQVTSNPLEPSKTGSYVTPGQAVGVAGTGVHAYVADGTHGIVVVDGRANPPDKVGGFDQGVVGHPVALDVVGDVLAIADSSHGLRLADVSTPDQPDMVGVFETRSTPTDVDLYRDYAFVALQLTYSVAGSQAKYVGGLDIVHVADPARPARGADALDGTNASGVQVVADRALVTVWQGSGSLARERGLHVVDVSRPLKPQAVIVFDEILEPSAIDVAQDIAFVTEASTGVWAVDVRLPEQPVKRGFVGTIGPAVSVAGWDGYAYVADGAAGLMVADMRDPNAPDRVASIGVGGEALDVAVAGSYVVVAAGAGGARLIDVHDPSAPVEVDRRDGRGTAISVAVRDDLVFVGIAEGSVQVFRIEQRELPTPTTTPTSSPAPTQVPTATPTPTEGPSWWTIFLPTVAVRG